MSDDKTIEISFESLGLTKPLEKMTAKELRQLCMDKIPQIQGASGMSKEDLVSTIKTTFGIQDEEGAVSPYKDQVRSIKRTIRELRVKKTELASRKDKEIMRRKINKLKKRTRRLAAAA
ncbi:C-terminal helicase domain-containing protein [Desulfovibrio aminophilus]|nr:C-terminal helicase domain-containing protein [Desulfovibrio aminophilus]MCM0754993.1 C-terminal helicase domain-containing protein [Desulfovibrio aminophilus]